MEGLPIELELRKLGLKEKEVRVYLAGLELGPSSVLNIAKKAGLTRPTAYEIIKGLEEKGLFTESREKKKRYFAAQSPENLLGILRIKKREVEEKEREFIRIIAALETKYSKEKEKIKVFKGKEGLKILEELISFSATPEIIIINSKNIPISVKQRKEIFEAIRKRLGKLTIREMKAKIGGSLIIFDKIIYFLPNKQGGLLIS